MALAGYVLSRAARMLIGCGVGVRVGVRVGLGVMDGNGVLEGVRVMVGLGVWEGSCVAVLVAEKVAWMVGVLAAWVQPLMSRARNNARAKLPTMVIDLRSCARCGVMRRGSTIIGNYNQYHFGEYVFWATQYEHAISQKGHGMLPVKIIGDGA